MYTQAKLAFVTYQRHKKFSAGNLNHSKYEKKNKFQFATKGSDIGMSLSAQSDTSIDNKHIAVYLTMQKWHIQP